MSLARKTAKWVLARTLYRKAYYRPRKENRPFLVRLDINNTCNLRCLKCFYPDYRAKGVPTRYMPLDEFRVLASRLFDHTYFLQLACAFEPLLHPEFVEILKTTDRYGIDNVGLVTNGVLLDGERANAIVNSRSLKALSVSLDGITPHMYERTRGRPLLDKVLGNITHFLDLRRRRGISFPLLKINSLLLRSNLAELPDLLAWCIEHGVDEVQFFHVQPIARDNDESALHAPDRYNAVRRELRALADGSSTALFIPPPLEPEYLDPESGEYAWRHCYIKDGDIPGAPDGRGPAAYPLHPYPEGLHCICPWMVLVVDAWGNLYPCAYRNDRPVGNILTQELEAAVNSAAMLRLRRELLRGRHREVCPFCKPTTPYADPLKRRIAHVTLEKEETRSVDAGAAGLGIPKAHA